MSVGCVIATYGDENYWGKLALRSMASAEMQTKHFGTIVTYHGDTLQEARNRGAEMCSAEDWLCFLDADDELDPGYVEAMSKIDGDIKRPATLGVHADGHEDDSPLMIPRCELRVANCIVIGAFIRHEQFIDVGGFGDDPVLEDWDLFIRLHLAGAEIVDVPDAVYRVHVNPHGRNTTSPTKSDLLIHGRVYNDIKNRYREEFQKRSQVTS